MSLVFVPELSGFLFLSTVVFIGLTSALLTSVKRQVQKSTGKRAHGVAHAGLELELVLPLPLAYRHLGPSSKCLFLTKYKKTIVIFVLLLQCWARNPESSLAR